MKKPNKSSPEQVSDAARLDALFQQWKEDQRALGNRVTQDSVAHALGMSQSAFSQFCRGVRPINIEMLVKAHRLFGWQPIDISPSLAAKMSEAASATGAFDPDDHALIRMLDARASAGKGELIFSDDISKMLMFRRDYLAKNDAKPENVMAFEVAGDSMIDMHIIDGAVVLANIKKMEPISKRVYVVWIDDELYVKQLIHQGGLWYARSRNASKADEYPDIQINIDDRVVGRAFWCGFGL